MSTMAMSTVTMDLRPLERAHDVSHLHPRAQGFRVLSRIARVRTDDYTPRHRRDVAVDHELAGSVAS